MDDRPENTKSVLKNPTVFRLGLVSLFADISSEMLYPITPIFLTTVLGASMASVGLIEGSAEAIAALLKTYAGFWSDRVQRRKPFVWFGYLLTAIAKPIIGMAGNWGEVMFARGLDRTGKGLRTGPRDALLAEAVPASQRGIAFGWHRAMDTAGATVGPLLALLYLSMRPHDLRTIYYLAVIPGMIAVLIVFSLRETPGKFSATKFKWRWHALSKPFKDFIVAWTCFSLVNSSDVFLLMKVKQAGMTLATVILIYCFYNLFYAFASPYLGHLSDRYGRKPVLIGGLLVFALVYIGFARAWAPWQYWLLFAIYGIYMAATDGVSKAFAVDLVPSEMKATGIGILGTFTALATVMASTTAGLLWDHVSPGSPFVFGAAGALGGAALLMRIGNSDPGLG